MLAFIESLFKIGSQINVLERKKLKSQSLRVFFVIYKKTFFLNKVINIYFSMFITNKKKLVEKDEQVCFCTKNTLVKFLLDFNFMGMKGGFEKK